MPAFAVSRLVTGPFDEGVIRETAVQLREQLAGKPSFGLVFVSPAYAGKVTDLLELIRVYGHVPALLGCSGTGLVGSAKEQEEGSGFSMLLFSLPGVRTRVVTMTQDDVEGCTGPDYWHAKTGIKAGDARAWFAFLNSSAFNIEPWLKQMNQAYPRVPVFGGRAGGVPGDSETWVFCDDHVINGGVALALEGDIAVHGVVSQGCKPIGEPLTVTQAVRNVLLTLGSRPAYEVLCDVYRDLSDAEREQARGHLFAGLAVSEYLEEYKRGDFLVRNILGADQNTGAVAINAQPRVGQTLQYQLRDSQVASDELRRLLRTQAVELAAAPPYAGLLCTCNGRGRSLFGRPNHDAGLIDDYFPGLPVAGFSTNGQIGPVGERSFEHGFTASLALFGPTGTAVKETAA